MMPGSKDLFSNFKMGNDYIVMRTISREKNFVYQIDNFGRTLLHWAVRRDNMKVAQV